MANQTDGVAATDQNDSLWTPHFIEDFSDGLGVDPRRWNYEIGNNNGWGNNELQSYTDSTNNVFIRDGHLVIRATKDSNGNITSGRITTKSKYTMKYGRIDAKVKLPAGTGLWPAIWMMPQSDKYGGWPASGEIDIMENKGRLIGEVAGTIHYGATAPNNKLTGSTFTFPNGQNVTDDHVYSLEWEPGELRWYVDGHLYQKQNVWNTNDNNGEKFAFPAPFDQDFYLIINLAFGGNYDNGAHDDTKLPAEMVVDYVHTYNLTGRAYKTPVDPTFKVTALPDHAKQADLFGNLLSNGDFSKPVQDNFASNPDLFGDQWNFVYGTEGSGTQIIDEIDGKKYVKVDVTSAGKNNYSVQLIQQTTLGTGRWYKVSFDAKAGSARNMDMKVGGGPSRSYTMYSSMVSFALTNSFQHFEKSFQMTHGTDLIARLEFELGLDKNSVWIGNVKLEEITHSVDSDSVIKDPLLDGNLIYNGAFDKATVDRLSDWVFTVKGAKANAIVPEDTRELNINIVDGGANSSSITLTQKKIPLINSKDYRLDFRARAEKARTIQLGIQSRDGKVTYLKDKTIKLTTAMQKFSLPMKMQHQDDRQAKLVFKLGGNNSNIYIDDVSLREGIDYSKVDIHPLINGNFSQGEDGLAGWTPLPNNVGDAASIISVVNGEAKIAITNPGTQKYSILLNQLGMKLSKGVEYKVAFDARSTVARSIFVSAENATFNQYFAKTMPLATTLTHYEYTFVMAKDDTVDLKFQLGNIGVNVPSSSDVFISQVKFEVIHEILK